MPRIILGVRVVGRRYAKENPMRLLNHCTGCGGVKQWVAVVLLAGASVGCGDQATTTSDGAADEPADEAAADDGGQLTLVMIPKATQATFWNQVRSGAEKAAAEFDVNLLWKGPARDNDRAAQK